MTNSDYIRFLQRWFPINKAKGLLAQISFEEEFESGSLKKHREKFHPGCWVVSPKSHDSNRYRYAVFVHDKMLKSDQDRNANSILGRQKENFYTIAEFLNASSLGVMYAVPHTDDVGAYMSKINTNDFSAVQWDIHFYDNGSLRVMDHKKFFSKWRSGNPPREPQPDKRFAVEEMLSKPDPTPKELKIESKRLADSKRAMTKFEAIRAERLQTFVLKELFYTGYLKSSLRRSADDPYDIDSFIVSKTLHRVFPIELKEKSPVFAKYKTGVIKEHYFGIDSGRISCLDRICSPTDFNAFYIIREVEEENNRSLLSWKFMTLSGIVMASSWNAIPGGTGMFGSGTSTVKLPYGEFQTLTEQSLDDDALGKISSRSDAIRQIARQYNTDRLRLESI